MMLQSSFLPFSRQVILEEQHKHQDRSWQIATAFPSGNDADFDIINLENGTISSTSSTDPLDLSPSLAPPSSANPSGEGQQHRYRNKMAFVAKAIILGIWCLAATVLVANLAVLIGNEMIHGGDDGNNNNNGNNDNPSSAPTQPLALSLSLSLDEATAKKISSVELTLREILDGNKDDAEEQQYEVLELLWPPPNQQDNKDCPHCGQTDDGGDDNVAAASAAAAANEFSGSAKWALKLNIYNNNNNNVAVDGHHRMLLDRHNNESEDATASPRPLLHGLRFAGRFRTTIRDAGESVNNLFPNMFRDKEEQLPSTDNRRHPFSFRGISGENPRNTERLKATTLGVGSSDLPFAGFLADNDSNNDQRQHQNHRRRLTSSSSTATVNTAFDDSEEFLLSLLEDSICDKIERALPQAFSETAARNCRLQYSYYNSEAEGIVLNDVTKDTVTTNAYTTVVVDGNDRDEHGCIASAGYSWCQPLNKCHRPWETSCGSDNDNDNDSDSDSDGGDGNDTALLDGKIFFGNDRDEHRCDRAAGYSWCETSESCHRAWETACDDAVGDAFGDDDEVSVKVA